MYLDKNAMLQNTDTETECNMGDIVTDRTSVSRKASTGSEYTSLSPDYSPDNTITPNSGNAILDQSFDNYFEMANQSKLVTSVAVTQDPTNFEEITGIGTPTMIEAASTFVEFGKNNYSLYILLRLQKISLFSLFTYNYCQQYILTCLANYADIVISCLNNDIYILYKKEKC